jgi:hypothetical protein
MGFTNFAWQFHISQILAKFVWPNLDEYSSSYTFIKFIADLNNLIFEKGKEKASCTRVPGVFSLFPYRLVLCLLFNLVTDIAENPLGLT